MLYEQPGFKPISIINLGEKMKLSLLQVKWPNPLSALSHPRVLVQQVLQHWVCSLTINVVLVSGRERTTLFDLPFLVFLMP